MIIINEFKLSDDLATISLDLSSEFDYDYVRVYAGDDYLTQVYYDVPLNSYIDTDGKYRLISTIYASQLGVEVPLTDIYILSAKDEKQQVVEAGIWSLEAPSQCLANKVLNYPTPCHNCKGINAINIMFMNIESTVMFLASSDFEKALKTLATVKLMCPDYGEFTIPAEGACPGGIGCWIIEDDFIVQ